MVENGNQALKEIAFLEFPYENVTDRNIIPIFVGFPFLTDGKLEDVFVDFYFLSNRLSVRLRDSLTDLKAHYKTLRLPGSKTARHKDCQAQKLTNTNSDRLKGSQTLRQIDSKTD